jgi:hypothetical protein
MEDHALAGDALGERGSSLAGGDEVHVAREERLGVGDERRALAQAKPVAGNRLDEEVQVRVRPEVGPGGGPKRDDPTQAVATSQRTQASVAGDRDAVVETPQERSVLVTVARPVRERSVDGSGEDAHVERAVAGSLVVEQACAQGGLVQQIDPELAVEGAQVGESIVEKHLVRGLGEAPDDQDGALLVGPTELDRAVGAGQHGQRLHGLDHREREADGHPCAGVRDGREPAVPVFDEPVVLKHAQGPLGAGERNPQDRRGLGGAQAVWSLREGNEGAQAMFGRDETAHERIMTLPA